MRDDASQRQVQAADPDASTWLSANAGSGKTRVLTDRVARLLLGANTPDSAGTEPHRILCLTYTKAAASEMQNRLFRRLGAWAMMDAATLRAQLLGLGIEGAIDDATLSRARRLFARAIETPGGLKIQTIHSFCASLLRRFPLEAGVSPQFTEMDDRTGELLRAEIVEDMADTAAPDVIARLASLYTGEDFASLAEEVAKTRGAFAPARTRAQIWQAFGLDPGMAADALMAQVFLGGEADWLRQVADIMATGKSTDIKIADRLRGLDLTAPGLVTLSEFEDMFLTGSAAKEPFSAKIGSLPTKDTRAALGDLLIPLENLMQRVESARTIRIALAAAEKTNALHRFAALFLPEYAKRKAQRGWLDFDDLILKARDLLTDPSVAQWVLFRLDGGIDHILVDEAQDTGPDQWKVVELLAQEFTAGQGARDTARTIFVVGDKKQSIYSFQGADLEKFDAMQRHFGSNLADSGQTLRGLELEHSFRSSPAILRAVDLTFDERRGADLGGMVKHIAFHDAMPGRVDLWPVLDPVSDPDPENWFDPVDIPSPRHHDVDLAERVAAEIARMIADGVQIFHHGGFRPVRPGDFLILVQRRSTLFREVIRACKALDLPIAGADRLKLGAEMAIKDLAALLSFLATPEDDLSLAAVLRSPLFGWSEAQLYDLAQPSRKYLWEALRAASEPETLAVLNDLRDRADYLRPFDLVDRMLTRHDGRRRLIARLGAEAEDGIDQFLSQALAYERLDVPSLTGFLTWLQTDDVEVKRQADSAGDRIRVMTVHGAKGLEAPVVILPDTVDRRPPDRDEILTLADGTPVWRTAADQSPAVVAEARALARERRAKENLRLLYVAMTRAECWLIVAGAGKVKPEEDGKEKPQKAWHELVQAGLVAAGAVQVLTPAGQGLRLQVGDWPAPAGGTAAPAAVATGLPDWASRAAAAPLHPVPLLSPSGLGGAKALPGEAGLSEAEALRRGTLLHLLLEHLPGHPSSDWPLLAEGLLAGDPASPHLLTEATAVLTAPALAHLFGPDTLAEVAVTADLDGRRMLGTVDRLVVTADRVLAVDYKSNAVVPAGPAAVPEGLLRQMGAYRAALGQVYPGRRIDVAILWTMQARLMDLPHDLVTAALGRAGGA